MKSTRDLSLSRPLRCVRLAGAPPWQFSSERMREAEEQAFERGRQQGEKDLSEQLLKQRSELLELQNGLFDSFRQALPQMARECEKTLVTLALEAARKLVAGMLITAEMVEGTVQEALARAEETTESTILLHPADLELLQQVNSPMLLTEVGGERLHLRASAEVTRGGCVIQTRFGIIDARRETKLELLRKSMEV